MCASESSRCPASGQVYFRAFSHGITPANWTFAAELDGEGDWLRLHYATDTKIRRHLKIKAKANPFDPAWDRYFEERALLKRLGKSTCQSGKSVVNTGPDLPGFVWLEPDDGRLSSPVLRGGRGSDAASLPDYAAYVQAHKGVEWLGCWAHARRRFFEAAAERPRTAARVLGLIGQLYALERAWDEAGVGTQRAAMRQQHFARPLQRPRQLVAALQARVFPKSGLAQACDYLLGHWAPLTAHLRRGRTQLDTNAVENAIRPSKLGAKNWLFIGHPDAGDRPAVIYSLVVSFQRQGHNPHDYLRDVLGRLPAMSTSDDLIPKSPSF